MLDGKILWDFDIAKEFQTVNDVKSHGGSINYAGAVGCGRDAVRGVWLFDHITAAEIPR